MPLASTSRVQMRYIKETVFGETPNTGTSKNIRMTGESFNYTINKEVSEEINADRASTSQIMVSAEAGGTLNAELSYAEYDPLIEGVLQGTWAPFGTNGVGTANTLTFAPTTITASAATAGANAFTNLKVGQWFTLPGLLPASPNYRKAFRVHQTTAPTTTVITLDAATPAVAEASVANVTTSSSRLTNGVVQPSFTFERHSADTNEFFAYRGMTPGSMTLSMSSGARTTIDFDFLGRDGRRAGASMMPGGVAGAQASRTYDIMSGVSGTTCALLVNGAPLTGTFISSISMTYDNALRGQQALCALGYVGIGAGTIALTLDIEMYFATGAQFYDEFLNNTNMSLTFTTFDTSGNGYVWTVPKANVATYTVNAGGRDADLMASVSLTGLLDNGNVNVDLRRVLIVDRIGAAVTP